jgi:aryl-alcohol dehydrogenase-like predicted oxidoreductase
MLYRTLGRTGLQVSVVALGAGPVSGLMTGDDVDRQTAVVQRAIERGINWIDTAAGYGQGRSESSLGRALHALGCFSKVHLATKVRISPAGYARPKDEVRRSFEQSLERLQAPKVTLLQLHNAITPRRGDIADAITPDDVMGRDGVLEGFEALRDEGLIDFIGLTGTGDSTALKAVVHTGRIDTVQTPFHLLNPSAGRAMPAGFQETDYGNVFRDCQERGVGVFAIRVFAAGALLGNAPSAHTKVTPYFPLALYERDLARGARIAHRLGVASLKELAVRYVLGHPAVTSGIIGLGAPGEVDDAVQIAEQGPLERTRAADLEALVDAEYRA